MKKILLFLYYGLFQHLPMQPFPGYKFGYWVRGKIASVVFKKCGVHPIIKNKCYFGDGSKISIGNDTQLGQNSRLQGTISIGDDCVMGPDVVLIATYHNFEDPNVSVRFQGGGERPICVGNDVWIGVRAVILPGVKLGDHCVVGAGAVITKSFPAYSIIAGVPGKVIGRRE